MNDEVPTRAAVEAKMLDLVEGRCSRDEASSWAGYWLYEDFERGRDLFDDPALLHLLERVSGLEPTDEEDIYHVVDFQAWLDELRQAK